MCDPVLKEYKDMPWLIHDTGEILPETVKAVEEFRTESAKYPLAPGVELGYPDDETPEDMSREDLALSHGLLYRYTPSAIPEGEKRVVLHIHGGGFLRGNGKYSRAIAIAEAEYFGIPAYACEYRYSPEYTYPAALDDCEEAWGYLVDDQGVDPGDIIIAGDSAGGALASALIYRLMRKGKEIPCAQVLFSPVLDLTQSGESHAYNLGRDTVFENLLDFSVYCGDADLSDPEVSPAAGDYAGFPPTVFFAEETEIFASDTLTAARRMADQGIRVRVYLSQGMFHEFPIEIPKVEESKRVYGSMREFIFQEDRNG